MPSLLKQSDTKRRLYPYSFLDLDAEGNLPSGVVSTTYGFVYAHAMHKAFGDAYKEGDGRYFGPLTRFYFVYFGKEYIRSVNRVLTRRGTIRVARRFAKEVVDEDIREYN